MPDQEPHVSQNIREVEGGLYKFVSDTIADGVTNEAVDIGDIISCSSVSVTNYHASATLKFRLGDVTNDIITVPPLSTRPIQDLIFDSIYLTNDSGVSINYDLMVIGIGEGV